jgi:hypothetical protein
MEYLAGIIRRCEGHCQNVSAGREKIEAYLSSSLGYGASCRVGVEGEVGRTSQRGIQSQSQSEQMNSQTVLNELETAKRSLSVITYLCQIISSMVFSWMEEPLFTIYCISRNLPIGTGIFQQRAAALLKRCGAEPRCLPQPSKLPSQSKGKSVVDLPTPCDDDSLSISDLVIHQFRDTFIQFPTATKSDAVSLRPKVGNHADVMCFDGLVALTGVESTCRETVLLLKSYLKSVFNLSDERCLQYNPIEERDKGGSTAQIALSEKDRERNKKFSFNPPLDEARLVFEKKIIAAWVDAYITSVPSDAPPPQVHKPMDRISFQELLSGLISHYNRLCVMVSGEYDDVSAASRALWKGSGGGRSRGKRKVEALNEGKGGGGSNGGESDDKITAAVVPPGKSKIIKSAPRKKSGSTLSKKNSTSLHPIAEGRKTESERKSKRTKRSSKKSYVEEDDSHDDEHSAADSDYDE